MADINPKEEKERASKGERLAQEIEGRARTEFLWRRRRGGGGCTKYVASKSSVASIAGNRAQATVTVVTP